MFGGWDENPRRYKSGFDQQAKLAQDVEDGTSLLRKHTGLNLYRGFESLALRQKETRQGRRMFGGWDLQDA